MENNVENHEAALPPLCPLRTSPFGSKTILIISISLICLLVLCSTTLPPYVVATFSILLLSTVFYFVLSKRRVPANRTALSQCGSSTSNTKSFDGEDAMMEAASPSTDKVEVFHSEASEVEATGFPSDSETTEESTGNEILELGWSCPSNLVPNSAGFKSGSSDFDVEDDDLIEINLPEGDPDGYTDGSKLKLTEFVCRKDASPMEISEDDMEEVDEDDSLIEIDLSIGSIKCLGGY